MARPSSSRKTKRAATLADVGREAGVSVMAVSAVINGARTSSRISEQTRLRILAAAEKLRYRPNAAARALADRRMNCIGVVTRVDSGDLNHYFVNLFNGILEAAAARQQNTTVFSLDDWHADASRLSSICDGRIDGVILLAPQFSESDEIAVPEHTPFVTIHANLDVPGAVNLETDEERGAYEMTRHLIEQGHRRIMHVSGPLGFRGAKRRVQGFERAHFEAGIEFDRDLLVTANFSQEDAEIQLRAWLQARKGAPLPDAVFCANDAMAVGCTAVFAEYGLHAPEDYSITGFDDIVLCRYTIPPLTTVRQPLREMGKKATETLLAMIDGKRASSKSQTENIVFKTDLVIRGTVGPAPAETFVIP